jgi:hypothetical protein
MKCLKIQLSRKYSYSKIILTSNSRNFDRFSDILKKRRNMEQTAKLGDFLKG